MHFILLNPIAKAIFTILIPIVIIFMLAVIMSNLDKIIKWIIERVTKLLGFLKIFILGFKRNQRNGINYELFKDIDPLFILQSLEDTLNFSKQRLRYSYTGELCDHINKAEFLHKKISTYKEQGKLTLSKEI